MAVIGSVQNLIKERRISTNLTFPKVQLCYETQITTSSICRGPSFRSKTKHELNRDEHREANKPIDEFNSTRYQDGTPGCRDISVMFWTNLAYDVFLVLRNLSSCSYFAGTQSAVWSLCLFSAIPHCTGGLADASSATLQFLLFTAVRSMCSPSGLFLLLLAFFTFSFLNFIKLRLLPAVYFLHMRV